MKNLLNPNIQYTDPDTLQFCLPLSDKEFWYCEPNCCHDKLLPESDSNERIIYDILCGYPKELISLFSVVTEIKEFISNDRLWCSGNISIDEIGEEERLDLMSTYRYSWDSFSSDTERNQLICECYFETYCITDFCD